MNIAVVFAGGVGKRMGAELPKQFIEIDNKPIIIHTLDVFEKNENVDKIVVSCLSEWIDYLKELLEKYEMKKVAAIVPGGETGQMSIFNGVEYAYNNFSKDSIVIIHDGVRPFIDDQLLNKCIQTAKEKGSAVSCVPTTETFMVTDDNNRVIEIPERSKSLVAKAPQCFYLKELYNVHIQAQKDGILSAIDSCTLMNYYKKDINVVLTDYDNIKITTPKDIALAESIIERRKKEK